MYTKIENTLKSMILKPGRCLLVGDSLNAGKDNSFKNTAIIDMLPKKCVFIAPDYPSVDIQNMPYEDNSFDFVIADQVLEHVKKPWIAVEEVKRVLKLGGIAILTSALMFPVHGVPEDYWRFTPEGLKVLCESFSNIISCSGTGNLDFAITCFKGAGGKQVKPGTDIEKRAMVCDDKHLVSVWIVAIK
jgi:SAM-dependent methyltransferase